MIRLSLSAFIFCLFVSLSSNLTIAQTDEITVDIVAVQVSSAAEKTIDNLIDSSRFVELGSEQVTIEKYSTDASSKASTSASSSVEFESKTQGVLLTRQQLDQITQLVEKDEQCHVGESLQTKANENQTATRFVGQHKTMCVSFEPTTGKFGSTVNQPVHRVIEDGTIIKNTGSTTNNGIQLSTNITINELTDHQRFTYDGSVTIDLPTCKAHQVEFNTELPSGGLMLIKSNHVVKTPERKMEVKTPLSKVPYVNRLFKSVGVQRGNNAKTYFIVSARNK